MAGYRKDGKKSNNDVVEARLAGRKDADRFFKKNRKFKSLPMGLVRTYMAGFLDGARENWYKANL